MYLAFKYALVAAMLAKANYCAKELDLGINAPIRREDLAVQFVAPPDVLFCVGRIDTSEFSFAFATDGKLQFIYRVSGPGRAMEHSRVRAAAPKNGMLSKKEAANLANRWLGAMDVDVGSLERRVRCQVRQRPRLTSDLREDGLSPVFDVRWGSWDKAKAEIVLDAQRKELLTIRIDDPSIIHSAMLLGTNYQELVSISDDDFNRMTTAEQEDLVSRFVARALSPDAKSNLDQTKRLHTGTTTGKSSLAHPISQQETNSGPRSSITNSSKSPTH